MSVAGDLDVTGHGRDQATTSGYERSARDVLRLVVLGTGALVLVSITRWWPRAIVGFESDLVDLVSGITPTLERILAATLGLVALVASLGTWVVPIATRRYRLFGYILLTNLLVALAYSAATWWIGRGEVPAAVNELSRRAGLDAASILDVGALAQLAGAFLVLGPFVTHRWRRAGTAMLGAMTVTVIVVSARLPAEVFAALLIGLAVGSAVLVVLGRPSRRPTLAAIADALADAALASHDLRPVAVTAHASTPYAADLGDGSAAFVKVMGEDERAADLLLRAYRFVRLKNVGDDRPFSTLRRAVEHEALVALYARDAGVRTPRLLGVVDVGADSMLLAYELVAGRSLDHVEPEVITDGFLGALWQQVALLHDRRIAHRDLCRANVLVDEAGRPWLIDFGFSELAADAGQLDGDVAQLIASLALAVGAERAVDSAVSVLGAEAVGEALPRLQPMALSGATQAGMRANKGLLAATQAEVSRRCGVEEVSYEQLSRVSGRSIFTLAVLAAATYFLLPQFADLPEVMDQVRGADWSWSAAVLLASVVTYLGATVALMGSVPGPLAPAPTLLAQTGASFASTLGPAGIGGMAVNVRYLQKQGVDHPVAVSAVGLNTVAGVVGHLVLLVVFLIWAGRQALDSFSLPDPKWLAIGVAGVLAVCGLSMALAPVRAALRDRLLPAVRRAWDGTAEVLTRPAKVVALVGGSTLITLAYLVALYFAVQAFGGGLSFATVGAAYLVGSAVGTAAPTPGGLGAMEAALIATLVALGLDNATALPAVFLFRFATFWIPIAPGWAAFSYLRRADYI